MKGKSVYLTELLKTISYTATRADGSDVSEKTLSKTAITALVNDNRKLEEGCIFLCIRGANFDGHSAAPDALKKGAGAIVVQEDVDFSSLGKDALHNDTVIIHTKDTRLAMAHIAAAWFSHPASELITIGLTGTKGKTTSSHLIMDCLNRSGIPCGLIGTIGVRIGEEFRHLDNTTPESNELQSILREMVEKGMRAVVMEVSSQALMLNRTAGFVFDIGIFTNIEPDHIGANEHKDFADYLHCKSLLFRQCKCGMVNIDDAHVDEILSGHTCEVVTFGFADTADFRAENLAFLHKNGKLGVLFDVTGKADLHVSIPNPGRFSVYNALAAIACASRLDLNAETIKNALKEARVKGRIEMVNVSDDFSLMIDYAHNAMALKSLLLSLKDYRPTRLVTVFGCGGNRARDRRYEMGEVSGQLSDFTIITSDNPRFEEPLDIMKDIEEGIRRTDGNYIMIEDRKEAIRYAIENGQRGDIIVLAGKGHEDYQEIKGVKYPMDERVLIREILAEREKG